MAREGRLGHPILSISFSTFYTSLKDTYTFVNLIPGVKGEPLAKYHLALPNVVLSYNSVRHCWRAGERVYHIRQDFCNRGSFLTYRGYIGGVT